MDLLNLPKKLYVSLAEAGPDGLLLVSQKLVHMVSTPPGGCIYQWQVVLPWTPQEDLHAALDGTCPLSLQDRQASPGLLREHNQPSIWHCLSCLGQNPEPWAAQGLMYPVSFCLKQG